MTRSPDQPKPGAPGNPPDAAKKPSVAAPAVRPPPAGAAPAKIEHVKMELPKGGGAIRGMGEKFDVNPATGTGSMSVPLPLTPGRGDLTPKLSLSYDSGAGNGPFGLGWSVGSPSIRRKTDKRLPTYLDAAERDVFLLAGAEDLVPVMELQADGWRRVHREMVEGARRHDVYSYRPRIEGPFSRIERWVDHASREAHWRVTTKENVTSIYGRSAEARIADPRRPELVFEWLLEETTDSRGNRVVYSYKAEDLAGVEREPHEAHRLRSLQPVSNRYLKRVSYNPFVADGSRFHLQVVFDYGEHGGDAPAEARPWSLRPDPFSRYQSGFDVRTYRLCERVLMFHNFPATPGGADDWQLVQSVELTYARSPLLTELQSVRRRGYARQPGGGYVAKALPPVELEYTAAELDGGLHRLDAESLRGAPVGLADPAYQWVDLENEGLSGILSHQAGGLFFKRNLGEGHFGPAKLVSRVPALTGTDGALQIADIDGDGRHELVVETPELQGFYPYEGGQWRDFHPFPARANVDLRDPNLKRIDLNGDGKADLFVSEDRAYWCYYSLGEDGYERGVPVQKGTDEDLGPTLAFADSSQAIYLADMSGDGLSDIVRIRNGEVCYWPNLGFGRFGAKVTMSRPPRFCAQERDFDPKLIRLGDWDGSGTTDIFYFGNGTVELWPNQAGNGFGPKCVVPGFPPVDGLTSLDLVDLEGTGTLCLVWSSRRPGVAEQQMSYLELLKAKPHLLCRIDNGLGKVTRLTYAPSTVFYREAERAGRPWATRLPFAVQVLSQVETIDEIGQSRHVSRYTYHHGYYDHAEREFRGFGLVESLDAEDFATYQGEPEHYVAPVLTRSWFHTGAFTDEGTLSRQFAHEYFQGDPGAFLLPDSVIEDAGALDADALREAYRAMKGSALRQEIYEQGHPVPYQVTEASFTVKRLQPHAGNPHAVFFVHPQETIESHYEQRANDPRVLHDFVLAVDDFGNITRACRLAYPRREVGAGVRPEQRRGYATVSSNAFINVTGEFHRVGVPREATSYELNADLLRLRADAQVTWSEARAFAGQAMAEIIPAGQDLSAERLQARTITQERFFYWDAAQGQAAPLGTVTAQALLHHEESAALTVPLVARAYGDALPEDEILAAGYRRDGDTYWNRGLVQHYTRGGFYLPCRTEDPFGGSVTVEYDAFAVVPAKTVDSLGNTLRVAVDYRSLRPWQLTDPNGNRSEALADPLGAVIATSVYGSEGGERRGDSPLFSEDGAPRYQVPDLDAPAVLADPAGFLQDATSAFLYDVDAWREGRGPPCYIEVARQRHLSDVAAGHPLELEISVGCTDGFGRELEAKRKAEPGFAWRRQPDDTYREEWSDERWRASGRVVYNNKGKPVRQYEPFYTASATYEPEALFARFGVSPLLSYDPLLRVVRTDLPLGVFQRVSFDAWSMERFDENDTVRESAYYARYAELLPEEQRALDGALAHADTPSVGWLDALGREFATVERVDGGELITHTSFTITGKTEAITDPRQYGAPDGVAAATYVYGMTDQVLRTSSMDAGEGLVLQNALGKPAWQRGARGHEKRIQYDLLQRPVRVEVRRGGASRVAERYVYGESAPAPEEMNLRGQLYRQYDQAGLAETDSYSFKGEAKRMKRRLRRAYAEDPDWVDQADWDGLLEVEAFTRLSERDALGRVSRQEEPDGSEKTYEYHPTGKLDRITVRMGGAVQAARLVDGITYNAKGQRERVEYGNGVVVTHAYEPKTFRLSRLQALRPSDGKELQDLRYTYDPAGNISEIRDGAQQDVFFGNAVVSADGRYQYDSLYRLTRAEGREHPGQQPADQDAPPWNLPHPNDVEALQRYVEAYTYDAAGNLSRVEHTAGTGSWTRRYQYADDSNRLQATSVPGDDATGGPSATYSYDAAGNMTRMPHLPDMRWDESERLRTVDRQGGGTVYNLYDAGGERVRKVYEHGGLRDERIYFGGYEVYRRRGLADGALQQELQTLHAMDDKRRVAMVETRTVDVGSPAGSPSPRLRLQLDNHLGSSALELDESGQVITYEEYHPYGTTSFHSARGGVEVSAKRYRYTGKERDEETGLSYHGARHYASWLGRWTSADPAGIADGLNLYRYVRGNPVRFVDADGHQSMFGPWGPMAAMQQMSDAINAVKSLPRDALRAVGQWAAEHPRTMGALKATGGALEVLGGGLALAAPEPTMVTKVVGVAAIAHGTDTFQAGLRQALGEKDASTLTSKGVETGLVAAHVDPHKAKVAAEVTDTVLGIGLTLGAGALGASAKATKVVQIEEAAAEGGARFIGRTGGDILDVTRIRIPGPRNSPFGKVDYLLGNVESVESVGKGGFFRGVLGFSEGNLGPALERHLIENFGTATIEGSRIRAAGTLVGPGGRAATVQSVWQVTPEGFVDLITAVPR